MIMHAPVDSKVADRVVHASFAVIVHVRAAKLKVQRLQLNMIKLKVMLL